MLPQGCDSPMRPAESAWKLPPASTSSDPEMKKNSFRRNVGKIREMISRGFPPANEKVFSGRMEYLSG